MYIFIFTIFTINYLFLYKKVLIILLYLRKEKKEKKKYSGIDVNLWVGNHNFAGAWE